VVLGDRIRLHQVIDNLLANARTHTPAATPVRLSVRRRGQDVELVVTDEGPGIPLEAQERVFERFWRADPGRVRERGGGTGLGLSIVVAHDGTVDLTSTPGPGDDLHDPPSPGQPGPIRPPLGRGASGP
jgi:two-component system OmpR family sensor kinase